MTTRRGRPAKYVNDREGLPVVGLSSHKASGRYYTTHVKPPIYFGNDLDLAISRFRAWELRQSKKSVTLPGLPHRRDPKALRATLVEIGWMTQSEADACTTSVTVSTPDHIVDEAAVWNWLRSQITRDPHRAAQRLGIPEIAYLTELKKPEPSLTLDEICESYLNNKKNLSDHWARKTKRYWLEFATIVAKQTLRPIDGEDIARYHDWVWGKVKKESRSPTWLNQRLGAVRTVLRYALKRGRDLDSVRRVLDLTEIFETKRRNGVDPRPIGPQHFGKLIAVADVKWTAAYLLALNACLYPKELADVRKSEIDLRKKTFIARRGKTGVIRCAVLWDRTVMAIRAYLLDEAHNSEYLLVSANGTGYSENHIGRNHRRRRAEAGLPDHVTFDSIRDGAYTAIIEAGFDLQTAKLVAGHGTGMSDAYVRRGPRMVAQACEAIEVAYFG